MAGVPGGNTAGVPGGNTAGVPGGNISVTIPPLMKKCFGLITGGLGGRERDTKPKHCTPFHPFFPSSLPDCFAWSKNVNSRHFFDICSKYVDRSTSTLFMFLKSCPFRIRGYLYTRADPTVPHS